jgi:hypothetical protein
MARAVSQRRKLSAAARERIDRQWAANGQFITVLPAADAVAAHKDTDDDETPDVSLVEYMMSFGIFLNSYWSECQEPEGVC